jgi:tetratricopeptide (TPR) repeat protein
MIYLRALEPTLFLHEHTNQGEFNTKFININQLNNKGIGAHTNLVLAYFNKDEINQVTEDIDFTDQIAFNDSKIDTDDEKSEIYPELEMNNDENEESPNKLAPSDDNNDLEVIDLDEAIEEIATSNLPKVQSVDINESTLDQKSKKAKKKKKNKAKKRLDKIVTQTPDLPNDEFIHWLFQLKPIQGSKIPKTKKSKKKTKVEIEVAKSILIGEDIASENLAILYEQQGHIDKALEMFHKLNLKYPEKSSYFAAKILELKSKIKND